MTKLIDQYLMLGALIVFGATSHALLQLSKARGDKSKSFDWIDFIIAFVISSFSGTIFGLVTSFWWKDPLAIYAVSGVGAFLGLKGLNSLSDALLDVIINRTGKVPKE